MSARLLLMWAVGVVLVGLLAVWLVKALLGLLFYLVVGALVIGGGLYLYRRVRRSVGGIPGRKRITK